MDKKIYIDGVNVSGCEHYRAEIETKMPYGEYEILKDKCHYSGIEVIQNCKGNKGCIYKQLKRKEQENEELKQENERLKANKGRCAFKCLDNTFCPEADKKITELELSRDCYKVNYETAKKYREKAEQALQEIREIADIIANANCNYVIEAGNIIKKINEVIGAE